MHALLRVAWADIGRLCACDGLHAVTTTIDRVPENARSVQGLASTLTQLALVLRTAQDEPEIARLVGKAEAVTDCLARVRTAELDEIRIKVEVLRARLEEILDPEAPSEATTLALVASIVRDLRRAKA